VQVKDIPCFGPTLGGHGDIDLLAAVHQEAAGETIHGIYHRGLLEGVELLLAEVFSGVEIPRTCINFAAKN